MEFDLTGPYADYPYSIQTAPYYRSKEQILAEFGGHGDHGHEHKHVEGDKKPAVAH